MTTLELELGPRSYPIYIGAGLLGQADLLTRHIAGKRVAIITNETIAPLYLARVQQNLALYRPMMVVLPDGEEYKTLAWLSRIFDDLLKERCDRGTTLIALGGGVVGDMVGFAAACYLRGVPFIQIPTTLLAQVDSSVGGKTGVNHPLGKNMIGAFYQPRAVIIDTATLATLPDKQFSSGLAEVIKYGLIRDAEFFGWLERNIDRLVGRDNEALTYAIERSCRNKADIVGKDETEAGLRAILNLGHTFAHAIEAGLGYGIWLHGEAVAVGMILAADLSRRLGWLEAAAVERLAQLLRRARLPIKPPTELSAARFIELMAVDKKVRDGKLRLVLLKGIGNALLTDQVPTALLSQTLNDYGAAA